MKKIVILTGAGISAESGLKTFRDSDGLWEGYDVNQVATSEAWNRDSELVIRFYNERRRDVLKAEPNKAHIALAELQSDFDVTVITQNIDNLHERAGSRNVMHLHGIITQSRSSRDPELIYDIAVDLKMGQLCEKGSQLRPHIVWFGEAVPMIPEAAEEVKRADIFIVAGTSLVVYPAAGLVEYAKPGIPKYLIDPNVPAGIDTDSIHCVSKKASAGVPEVVKLLFERN